MYPLFEGWCASEILHSATSVKVGHGDPCGSKDTRVIDMLETMEAPRMVTQESELLPPKRQQD